jgi:hypothetical protein
LNGKGYGSYTQGGVSGFAHVYHVNGYTIVVAVGAQVRLLGVTKGTYSKITEVLPKPVKAGTFSMS